MRIKQISVVNLFGTFNHEIPLNLSERATIMIGPNGYGKTMILKMVDGIFNGRFSIFFKIPFQEFSIYFDDGKHIKMERKEINKIKGDVPFKLILSLSEDGIQTKKVNLTDINPSKVTDMFYHKPSLFEDEKDYRKMRRMLIHGSKLDTDAFYSIFEHYLDIIGSELIESKRGLAEFEGILSSKFVKDFSEIRSITKEINVHFIQAQRLISSTSSKSDDKSEIEQPVVNIYSKELAKIIADKLAQSTEKAQQLDSTFPDRVISKAPPPGARETYKQLRDQLQILRDKRRHLKETGILVDLGTEPEIPEYIEDVSRVDYLNGVLTEYVKDTQEKLAIFDELSDKIEILKRIINIRFAPHKRLEIHKDKGFVFITSTGDILTPSDLSSGEQHELVLLYELLFNVPSNSLVLIDEPELSLHIEWQQKFFADLLQITEIAKFDVLIATHAPDIIHDYWSLTVDLEE